MPAETRLGHFPATLSVSLSQASSGNFKSCRGSGLFGGRGDYEARGWAGLFRAPLSLTFSSAVLLNEPRDVWGRTSVKHSWAILSLVAGLVCLGEEEITRR
jgi:hypothetical protein